MSTRIADAFARAKSDGRGAFVAYLTVGYPTVEKSDEAIEALIAQGADVIELGVPFSDPFADGSVIRSAAYRALENGVTLDGVLELAGRVRARHPDVALVLFTYYNVIFSKGLDVFAASAAKAGIDAVLSVDLPLEEREELLRAIRPHGITYVPLIAPNTPIERVVESAKGLEDSFLYVITVKGITGERKELPPDLTARLDAIRAAVKLPIAAGFGISTKEMAEVVCAHADGYVVGTAIVRQIGSGSLDFSFCSNSRKAV